MLTGFFGFGHYIIDIVLDATMHHIMKYYSYCPLVCGPSIFQSERHCVIEFAYRSSEYCLLSIFGINNYLIISAKTIHEKEH